MFLLSPADSPDPALRGGVISIGNFDGVHQGHARLIARLRAMAQRIGGPAVAVTFDPPPVRILRPGVHPELLTTPIRRAELLRRCGADGVVVIRTTADLLRQSPETFFHTLIQGSLQARGMVEGPNFFFGRNRAGNPHLLKRLCAEANLECEIVEPTTIGERMVSSTRIRELLIKGDVEAANELLTAPFRLSGRVVPGAGRGRGLGVPTANLSRIATLVPGAGVYACRATIDGEQRGAAVHIGPNPTFDEAGEKVEVHVLDFEGDLYDSLIDLDFVRRLRGVETFADSEALKDQLFRDLDAARQALQAAADAKAPARGAR